MKRILLAGAGVLAMASLANAADLPRQMYSKAPPPMVAPYYNWTGFYIGINGGGAWGTSTWDSTGGFDVSGGMIGGTIGSTGRPARGCSASKATSTGPA